MEEQKKTGINLILQRFNITFDDLPTTRKKQIEKIYDAIQERKSNIENAEKMISDNQINLSTIAADTKIERKTFYNQKLLKDFIEVFSTAPSANEDAKKLKKLKEELDDANSKIEKLIANDIEKGKLEAENKSLKERIKKYAIKVKNLQHLQVPSSKEDDIKNIPFIIPDKELDNLDDGGE